MYKAEIDIAVLILFFNRPEPLEKVFEQVRKARPARLFLYQDGPRGETMSNRWKADMEGINACRNIVSKIDWECEVQHLYQERNYGCDPSEYISQKWAFSLADKCIVLEDDDVPSVGFFHFCKEMLDRYEDDPRIEMIAGFNAEEVTPDIDADYFFTKVFSIWGWASWKRVIDRWDPTYSFLDQPDKVTMIEGMIRRRELRSDFLRMCRDHRASGKEFYESIFWADMILNDTLAIMPTRNMVNNLGPLAQSTHFSADLDTQPAAIRRMFTMQRYETDAQQLMHPVEVNDHAVYRERIYRLNAWGHPWVKVARSIEELWLNLRRGRFSVITKAFKRRVRIWLGMEKNK